MKAFVAVLCLAVAVSAAPLTDEQMKKGEDHVRKCLAEHNITPELVQKLKAGDFTQVDETAKCFIHCFMRAADFVHDSGDQRTDVIIHKLSANKDKKEIEAAANKCKQNIGSTPCEKSYNAYKCYRETIQF